MNHFNFKNIKTKNDCVISVWKTFCDLKTKNECVISAWKHSVSCEKNTTNAVLFFVLAPVYPLVFRICYYKQGSYLYGFKCFHMDLHIFDKFENKSIFSILEATIDISAYTDIKKSSVSKNSMLKDERTVQCMLTQNAFALLAQ